MKLNKQKNNIYHGSPQIATVPPLVILINITSRCLLYRVRA